jgi:tetratricopeptide (TPR) repeat protein
MKSVVRVKERSGACRQLSVGEAVAEAYEHLKRGDNPQAVALLNKAVQYAPAVPVVRYLLGVAQVRQKLFEPGIANLEKAVRADESNADYLISSPSSCVRKTRSHTAIWQRYWSTREIPRRR